MTARPTLFTLTDLLLAALEAEAEGHHTAAFAYRAAALRHVHFRERLGIPGIL